MEKIVFVKDVSKNDVNELPMILPRDLGFQKQIDNSLFI